MSPDTSGMSSAIGAQISLRLKQRGMTSAELARRAGISKGTMSALEAGKGNPTINTLDALAVALRIPLTDLLARDTDPGPVFVASTELDSTEVKRELQRRISGGHSLEIWRMRIPANCTSTGLPHASGTVEHLFVASGHLIAGPSDNPHPVGPGDMLAFAGDAPHIYIASDEPVDMTVVFAAPVLN